MNTQIVLSVLKQNTGKKKSFSCILIKILRKEKKHNGIPCYPAIATDSCVSFRRFKERTELMFPEQRMIIYAETLKNTRLLTFVNGNKVCCIEVNRISEMELSELAKTIGYRGMTPGIEDEYIRKEIKNRRLLK